VQQNSESEKRSRAPQERRVGQARWPRPTRRKGESSGERPAAALRGLHRDGAAGWRAGQYIPVIDEGGEEGRAEDGRDGRRVVEGCKYLVLLSSCCALV
jgi:hypothetical protein